MSSITSSTWTNWVGNQSFTPRDIVMVDNEAEVQHWVAHAAEQRLGVRTYGTGHSFTPIVQTDGLLLNMERMRGILAIDPNQRLATALPKTTIGDFGEPLWAQGLALANQGDIDTQAIAGAIATATHGSGRRFPNFRPRLQRRAWPMAWATSSRFRLNTMPMCCLPCKRPLVCLAS